MWRKTQQNNRINQRFWCMSLFSKFTFNFIRALTAIVPSAKISVVFCAVPIGFNKTAIVIFDENIAVIQFSFSKCLHPSWRKAWWPITVLSRTIFSQDGVTGDILFTFGRARCLAEPQFCVFDIQLASICFQSLLKCWHLLSTCLAEQKKSDCKWCDFLVTSCNLKLSYVEMLGFESSHFNWEQF